MIHIEQLYGNWISKDCYPVHLGKDGYTIRFGFEQASGTAGIAAIGKDKETVIIEGEVQIETGLDRDFMVIIAGERISVRNFANDRFIADIPEYGEVTVYKMKVLGIRMSF